MNKINANTASYVNVAKPLHVAGSITVNAESTTDITSQVTASAVAVVASKDSSATAISIGLSLSRNEIDNSISAAMTGTAATPVTVTSGGDVTVSTDQSASIDATGRATAVAVALGVKGAKAVSGSGTLAFNTIRGGNTATIDSLSVQTTHGDLSVISDNDAHIVANLRSVALSVAVGGGTGSVPSVAVGLSVARNMIGGEREAASYDKTTADSVTELSAGTRVKVTDGPLDGDIYEYIGDQVVDADGIALSVQNYGDSSAWKLINFSVVPATTYATMKDSRAKIDGVLTVDAHSTAMIDARVVAGAAAVAASSQNAYAVSAAGVYSENRISNSIRAMIEGDGVEKEEDPFIGIQADAVAVHADNGASINAIAGAASLAASLSGQKGIAVSIGLSLAFNSIDSDVLATIKDVDGGLTAGDGHVELSSSATGARLFESRWSDLDFTADDLDNATSHLADDSDTADVNESDADQADDARILAKLVVALAAQDLALAAVDTIHCDWVYTTADDPVALKQDETVRVGSGHTEGGKVGRVYRYLGADSAVPIDLSQENFADGSRWALVVPSVTLSQLEEGRGWLLVDADGSSYTLLNTDNALTVNRTNINALSVAASMGVGVGGTTGAGVSGAGAVAINAIQGNTDAFIRNSKVVSAGDVTLTAVRTSQIAATVAAASLAAGVGGTTGVGASIGIAVARNFIGFDGTGHEAETTVRACLVDTAVDAAGNLELSAFSRQSISALVVAGSVAIGGGGTTGVGISGSGVWAENRISADIAATVTNSALTVINAASITLDAEDVSRIRSLAGAASVAAALGGTTGVALSIGVSLARNMIDNTVTATLDHAAGTIQGTLTVVATEASSIDAVSAAASLAAGIGGTTGIAVSGAGAEAKNIILTDANASIQNSDLEVVGDVVLTAANHSTINALVAAVSLAAGVGGTAGVGASIGVAIARNYIGWNPNAPSAYEYTLDDEPESISYGDRVKIERGARAGDVYRYIGENKQVAKGNERLLLQQDYGDDSLWEQVNVSAADAQVRAFIQESSLSAGGALRQTAESSQLIQALVLSGSVALSGGGTVGVALSGAGASGTNLIGVDVEAFIDGDGAKGIEADTLTLHAEDGSTVRTVVGAASVAASFGGTAGVSFSIGLALAHNEISNTVSSYIAHADHVVVRNGDLNITALSSAVPLFTVGRATMGVSAAELDDATKADEDDSNTANVDEKSTDSSDDQKVLNKVVQAFGNHDITLDGAVRLSRVSEGEQWLLVEEDGGSYLIQLEGSDYQISRSNIDAMSVAASVGAAIGGTAGVAISGAGALADNVVLTDSTAYILDSSVTVAGRAHIDASSFSAISAVVGAVSVAAAAGGAAGVGVSIGVAIANNSIGDSASSGDGPSGSVLAFVRDSSISVGEDLDLEATARQTITSVVLSGSVALAGGGAAGVGGAGSGVKADNRIQETVSAFIDGDGGSVIEADTVTLLAEDVSQITSIAGAAAIAASFGGAAGVSVSIGVSLACNRIENAVSAYVQESEVILDQSSDLSILASESSRIETLSAAAAVAAGFGGAAGVGVSGAGASALNIILGDVRSFIADSNVHGEGESKAGDVVVEAINDATINAYILTAALAAGGGTVGVGASIGIALARNYIGYDPYAASGYTYLSGAQEPSVIRSGDRVQLASDSGVRAGETYRYIGTDPLYKKDVNDDGKVDDLILTQDYADRDLWEQVVATSPGVVTAYVAGSELKSRGDVLILANSEQQIDAQVFSGSVAISAGLVAVSLSGAGSSAENRMNSAVSAYLLDDPVILLDGELRIRALDSSEIVSNVAAASIAAAFGIGGAAAIGIATADNLIANTVVSYISGVTLLTAGGDVLVDAEESAHIDAKALAVAAAAGLISIAGGGAYAGGTVATVTRAEITGSNLLLSNDSTLSVLASSITSSVAELEAAAASFGAIAAAASGTVAKLTVNPEVNALIDLSYIEAGDVVVLATGHQAAAAKTAALSVSTGVSVGASEALLTDKALVHAGLGNQVTVLANALNIQTDSLDSVLVRSSAASGGVFAGIAGANSVVTIDSDALVTIGNNNALMVETLYVNALHDQRFDSKAENLAVGILAGSGAIVINTVSSSANVVIGQNSLVEADSIIILANNKSDKSLYANENNLQSASAGLIGLSALASASVIGSDADPFQAVITIGQGSRLLASGSSDRPGRIQIEALTDVYAVDSVKVEGVAGFSLSIATSILQTSTLATVNLLGAQLENASGDITVTAKSDAKVNPSSNLFSAAMISGGASIATGQVHANNTINVSDSQIKARNVNMYAGRNEMGVSNQLNGSAAADMALVSLMGLGVPVPTMTINEHNLVNLQGNSQLKAMQDVDLVAKEGQGGDERGTTSGMVVSLSMIPYAVDVPDGAVVNSVNQVLIGDDVRVEAGMLNKALLHVLPLRVNGEQQLDPSRLGSELTLEEKAALELDADQHYEYALLPVDKIALNIATGTLVKMVSGAGGEAGSYYVYAPVGAGNIQADLYLEEQNYANTSTWSKVTVLSATETVNAVKAVTRVRYGDDIFLYMGDSKSVNLATQTYDTANNWSKLAVYDSDVGSSFTEKLSGKFYVIKQVDMELPTVVYANVGNKLFEQREQLLEWMTSHNGNSEAIARYQAQLDQVNQALADLGLGETVDGQMLVQQSFDQFFVNIPNVYASPGSIFVTADANMAASLDSRVGTQLLARAGANINILNTSPFGLQVNDLGISSSKRVTVVDDKLVSLNPGHIYLNNSQIDTSNDFGASSKIQVVQDAYPNGVYDLAVPSVPQDLYILGQVVNDSGALVLKNLDGNINVSGEVRAGSVSLSAKGNFNLSSDTWYHSNVDPRQYVDYTTLFNSKVFNSNGAAKGISWGSLNDVDPAMQALNAAIHKPVSRVIAQGDINIQARYINIDGLVQSGVEHYGLTIDSTFAPTASTGFTDALGNTISGIHYGEEDVPVSGFFDANSGTILLDPIIAKGGNIAVTGQILSTGNGQLRVASGYASVDIVNNSQYKLAVDTIDVSKNRIGTITVTDSTTLARVVYKVQDGEVTEKYYQGVLVEPEEGTEDVSTITYTQQGETRTASAQETLFYQPTPGQYYIWVEGQEKTRVVVNTYEQKSFNLLGFDWDALAADSSAVSTDTQFRDSTPLLESEVPVQLNAGYAYYIGYEQRRDTSIAMVKNVTEVVDVSGLNWSDSSQYNANMNQVELSVYRYIGSAAQEVLHDSTSGLQADFTDTSKWERAKDAVTGKDKVVIGYLAAKTSYTNKNDKYLSTFENETKDSKTWTTGGGWLREKTVHTEVTTVTGLKDFYTNVLRADYPIVISFLQGGATPTINIQTPGALLLSGDV
ncbi:MAG: hypothetical protein HQM06_17230, partial [Magnetococcales bacterium]|nr:hypothetical protein [Magnetococcales bacterium]